MMGVRLSAVDHNYQRTGMSVMAEDIFKYACPNGAEGIYQIMI